MLTIKQAAVRHLDEPQLLPDLFPSLKKEGIRFRRGQVTMIAGQRMVVGQVQRADGAPSGVAHDPARLTVLQVVAVDGGAECDNLCVGVCGGAKGNRVGHTSHQAEWLA